jgi:hypothetical protein
MVQDSSTGSTEYWRVQFGDAPDASRRLPSAKNGGLSETGQGIKLMDESRPRQILSWTSHSFFDWKVWLMLLVALHILAALGLAQTSKEYQVKAVFLWRLAQFTEWPPDVFEHADSPIVLCVLGENPFGDALEQAVVGETAHGRRLVLQQHRGVQGIKTCHILYISAPAARHIPELSAALAGKSVLTVRDSDGSDRSYDAIVRFITEQNKINLRINPKAATAARLVLDPRLLRAAEIVGNE